MNKQIMLYVLILIFSTLAFGCGKKEEPISVENPVISQVNVPTQGETFLATGFKIKSTITPTSATTLDQLVFEVYVDGTGSGTGLVGYKDKVYDVVIVSDKVYIKMADSVAIQLSELAGHMYISQEDISKEKDLTSKGYSMLNNIVTNYKSSTSKFLIDSSYTVSDSTFDEVSIASGNSMTISEFIEYLITLNETGYVAGGDTKTEEALEPEKGSFWNNSWLGVKIHDKTYSIGDFCNPSTYFEGLTPEGITPSYSYNGDNKVELRHITYQSSDGRTSFMTTEGYVQTISTSSDFEFLGLKRGMSEADLKYKLGIGLKKAELEDWKPIVEGLETTKGKAGVYHVEYDKLSIDLKITGKEKVLGEITVTNYIDFLDAK